MKTSAQEAVRDILHRVQSCVRNLDYEGVRDLIPDDGVYFGSVAIRAQGYEELRSHQFEKVWPNIREFAIQEIAVHDAGSLAWATCLFESFGPDPGENTKRRGRMTFVFELRDDRWVMVHSHDSLFPIIPGAAPSDV